MVRPARSPSPRFAYLAHCLLNANSKVGEGALCAGIHSPILKRLRANGWTIRQMPCPELAFAGLRRFWAVREQYETPAYRAHCTRLARAVAGQVEADLQNGGEALIVGIDGSPSMGVHLTASAETWGGRPSVAASEEYPVLPGAGLFTEHLLAELEARGVRRVRTVGIAQDVPGYDEGEELTRLEEILAETL